MNQENISEKELIEKIKIADKLITMKEKDIHNYNKIKRVILYMNIKKRA